MTFADRLEELRKAATPGPWTEMCDTDYQSYLAQRSSSGEWIYTAGDTDMELIMLLRNHADAILELVRAADKLMRLYKKSVDVGPHNNPNTEANICRCINEVLAKLNGEQT